MLLITSGAYVESELFAEFGKIPPAFLPVGNKRLFSYQIAQFAHQYDCVGLTLPADFQLDEADAAWLRTREIGVWPTRPGASLAEALLQTLQDANCPGRVDILYGDTLITDPLPDGSNWVAVGQTDEYYNWYHTGPVDGQPGGTWTGMFSFADQTLLKNCLEGSTSFIDSVNAYGRAIGGLAHWPVAHWLDFGHVHTYFDSKRIITTQRHFNQLCVNEGVVTKCSGDTNKVLAEASWFEQAPASVKPFLAPYISRIETAPCGYQLEYLHLAALNELYVFGRLPERVWCKIFGACDTYLKAARAVPVPRAPDPAVLRHTYLDKTLQRLEAYAAQTACDLDQPWQLNGVDAPSLREMAHHAADAVVGGAVDDAFIHGDLCFSNILFDFRAGRIKIIDPRGTDARGRPTPYGDPRYDIGKLAHSVLGLYDFIVAGCHTLVADGQALEFRVLAERCAPVQARFLATAFCGRMPHAWDCYPVMVLLFLSMLPLHADDRRRQQALMANGIRLYLEWISHDHYSDGRTEPALS
jgi:hypothetical protein